MTVGRSRPGSGVVRRLISDPLDMKEAKKGAR